MLYYLDLQAIVTDGACYNNVVHHPCMHILCRNNTLGYIFDLQFSVSAIN